MSAPPSEPYTRRPVRFLELLAVGDWRLKVYGIAYRRSYPRSELIEAARRRATGALRRRPTRHRAHGVGFLGIHDGRGANQVFLDLWINDNELWHRVWISPTRRPEALELAPRDHNSVCVWDLWVQAFERQAWIRHALERPGRPDLEGYLAERFDGEV